MHTRRRHKEKKNTVNLKWTEEVFVPISLPNYFHLLLARYTIYACIASAFFFIPNKCDRQSQRVSLVCLMVFFFFLYLLTIVLCLFFSILPYNEHACVRLLIHLLARYRAHRIQFWFTDMGTIILLFLWNLHAFWYIWRLFASHMVHLMFSHILAGTSLQLVFFGSIPSFIHLFIQQNFYQRNNKNKRTHTQTVSGRIGSAFTLPSRHRDRVELWI